MIKFRQVSHIRGQVLSTYLGNFIGGFCIAIWAPLIPFIQKSFSLSNIEMGHMVLLFGIGSVCGMFASGIMTQKLGTKITYIASCLIICSSIIALTYIPPILYIVYALVIVFGFAVGCFEVAINIYGAYLEKRYRMFLMSPIHAAYSLGEFCGATFTLIMLSLNFHMNFISSISVSFLYISTFFIVGHIFNIQTENKKSARAFALPRGAVIFFAIIVAFTYIAGGAMIDWSSLYVTQEAGVDLKYAASGYLIVTFCMLICRLYGSRIVKSFGPFKTAYYGAILLSSGLLLIVSFDSIVLMYAGFVLVGIGMSNISPLCMSATTKQNDMPLIAAVSTVAIAGYTGLLFAPAVLGYIAHIYSLSAIFALLALSALISAFLIYKTRVYFY